MTHLSALALLMLHLLLVVPIPASNPPVTQHQSVDNFEGLSPLSKHFDSPMASPSTSNIPSSDFDSASGNSTRILRRGKRYLQFSKGSRMSWRTNGKNNLWTINTLYAYGYGFRANYPFPSIEEQKKDNAVFFRLFKRDLFSKLETALDGHGFDGRACMLKSFCTAINDVDNPKQKSGMLFKMLKLIFRLDEHDKRHMPHLREENCEQIMHSHCPLSFDSISPYTDDV
ncbi:uncharacterized protein LOC6729409 [Drosophila simulans]|uniref:uncharacterized protein LOC6729409 n=1 Tax=Drosophila simulans TaxID=7240 RepID=UPI00078AF158|nr:uncharacterized protein LOC6729409 [Drosophila simulans]KMZ05563.1 uncharacterized protein Dsimw501_GD18291, isoform C [Drosophila simulans]